MQTDAPDNFTDEMHRHLEETLGPSSGAVREIVPFGLPLDILVFPPHGKRHDWVFVTAGMSARAMPGLGPDHQAQYARAELMIALSGDQAKAALADKPGPRDWAPLEMLKRLARYPHEAGTFIAPTQTADISAFSIDFGMARNFPAVLFLPPPGFDGDLFRVPLANGQQLNIYGVIPLYAGELQVALDNGTNALFDILDPTGVTERFDPTRPDGSKKQRWFS